MARRVIGLDLGAYSVKLVRLLAGKQTPKFEVLNVIEERLTHKEDDERSLADKQREAIAKLMEMAVLDAEVSAAGISASDGQMRTMQVPSLDNRKLEAVLPGLLESELPFDLDDMVISWHRSDKKEKNKEASEFANIRVGLAKKPTIVATLQTLQTFSIDPRLLLLGSVAPYELIRELSTAPAAPLDNELLRPKALNAIVDFGHRSTNLCIFDNSGVKYSRSFLHGGEKLTHELAQALAIPFVQAEEIKHTAIDLSKMPSDDMRALHSLARNHYQDLLSEILRTFISLKTAGVGEIDTVAFIGGATAIKGFSDFVMPVLAKHAIRLASFANLVGEKVSHPSMVLAFSYALSCLQIHAKDNRFNFRKDEFTWRGDLDFLRTKSTPLILWSLGIVCALTVMWSASSLVLQKENQQLENQLKSVCNEILGQKNIAPKKCLAQMKEQISANIDMGVPEFAASDVYVKLAELLPKELDITISELDVLEKKLKIMAKTKSFEDVDKIFASISKIPCLLNVQKGNARNVSGLVEFQLSSDIDCNAARNKQNVPAVRK